MFIILRIINYKYCTPIFIAALFMIAERQKQPKCPSVGKWINIKWYIHTMEYNSAL